MNTTERVNKWIDEFLTDYDSTSASARWVSHMYEHDPSFKYAIDLAARFSVNREQKFDWAKDFDTDTEMLREALPSWTNLLFGEAVFARPEPVFRLEFEHQTEPAWVGLTKTQKYLQEKGPWKPDWFWRNLENREGRRITTKVVAHNVRAAA